MTFPFDDEFRALVVQRCAAFRRLPATGATTLKRAAVAITLVETDDGSDEAAFLLTERASGLRAHSGQWALPGGRLDPGESAEQAALREIHEEIGLALDPAVVLGTLDDYPTRSGYLITPVVVWAGARPPLQLNPHEVASVRRITIAHIAQDETVDFVAIPESERRVVRIRLGRHFIHAPTAAVLYQFREVLAGRDTRVIDLDQPVFAWR